MASKNATVRKPKIHTHEGAVAKHINPEQQLRRSVMSCLLFEKDFYEDGQSIADRIKEFALLVKPEKVAAIAIEAKQKMKLRHVPLYLTVILCSRGYNVRKLVPRVVTRTDDMTELLSLYWNGGKKPLAKSLQRGLGDAFRQFDEYQLAKYRGDKKSVKLKDVLKLCRPKPTDEAQSELWKRVVSSTLATPDTWEVAYSAAKTPEEKKAVWDRLVSTKKLGGLAVLRNIRNMEQVGYDAKLAIKGINSQKLLPINFIKCAEIMPKYEPWIENKFMEIFTNKEKFPGKTILLVDVSGSMDTNRRSANAGGLAMIAREFFSDIEVFIFGDHLRQVPARRGFALRDAVKARNEGTNLGKAISEIDKNAYDRLIVITDEQSRDNVSNPKGKAYMINVACNRNGIGYGGNWMHIDGWSDKILDYIVEFEKKDGKIHD